MFYETILETIEKGDRKCEIQTFVRIYKVCFFLNNQYTHSISAFTLEEANRLVENFMGAPKPILLSE